jgi:serine kinase of HPr protein (carbohydrate metabolism regulator)
MLDKSGAGALEVRGFGAAVNAALLFCEAIFAKKHHRSTARSRPAETPEPERTQEKQDVRSHQNRRQAV